MLMTKKKILATIVATTLCISTIMPSVALALDTVEPTEPTTVETTETEPAASEKPIVKETEATTETTVKKTEPVEPSEESSETTVSEDKNVEETQSSETTPKDINESDKDSTPTTSETTVETEATEPTESTTESTVDTSEAEPTAFNQSVTVDGIKITVEADPGVFPEGAELKARKINKVAINKEDNIVSSMTFDICIYVGDKEVEPDTTKGNVKVTFFDERFEDKNLDAAIYHTTDDKKTVEMDYDVVDGGAQTKTDGFSLYTVEFTYADMQYVLTGNSSVALSTILKAVGLEGEVTDVTFSNDSLIKYEDGNIFALKAFTSKEWMKVTINGITYIITVTDNPEVPEDATAGTDAYAVLYSDGTLAFQKGNDAIAAYGTIINSWLIPTAYPADDPDTEDVNESYPDWYASADTITKVVFVDNIKGITSLAYYFYRLSNIDTFENLDRLDTKDVTSLYGTFSYCSSIEDLDLSSWNTSKVTNISTFVMNCSSLKTLNLSNWDFSVLNSTGGALSGCTALKTLDLSNTKLPVDTYNAGLCLGWHMSGSSCSLDEVIVTSIDLSQTTSLYGFLSIPAKKVTGLTTWDVSNVVSISSLFNGNSLIENVDISGWDLRNMRNTYGSAIFSGCANLKTLNMSNVKMPADTAASNFQLGWGNIGGTLNSINVTNLDLSSTTSLCGFLTVPAKNIIGLDTWDTSHVTNFNNLFTGQKYITELDLSNFTFKAGDTVMNMCVNMNKLERIILPESYNNLTINDDNNLSLNYVWTNVDTNVTVTSKELTVAGTYEIQLDPDIAYVNTNAYAILTSKGTLIFQNSDELTDTTYGTVVETWEVDTSNHPWNGDDYKDKIKTIIFKNTLIDRTSAYLMFNGCSNLTKIINPEKFDTSKITDMDQMFSSCPKLTSIDISTWDTSKVTDFNSIFYGDTALTEIKGVEHLVTSSAKRIRTMFYNCSSLTSIDVSTWDTSNVTNMNLTFRGSSVTKLDLRNWDFSKVTNIENFVYSTVNLKTIILPASYANIPVDIRNIGFVGNWESITTGAKYTGEQMNNLTPVVTDTYHAIATAGANAYAILYADGYLVFQLGNIPDEETHGTALNIYNVPTAGHPWDNEKSKIKVIDFKDKIIGINNTDRYFEQCINLTSVLHGENLDTSAITDVGWMFSSCPKLATVEGSGTWTLENCDFFAYMFGYHGTNASLKNTALKHIDLSGVDSSKGTNFFRMFEECNALEEVDFSNWDFSNAVNSDNIFYNCKALKKIVLPESATKLNTDGINSVSANWIKNDTEKVYYTALNAAGTYEKYVNDVTLKVNGNAENNIVIYLTAAQPEKAMPTIDTDPDTNKPIVCWKDANGLVYDKDIINSNTPKELFASYEYEPQTAVYGEDLYLMIYSNANSKYTFVYQKGNTPDPEYGTFVEAIKFRTDTGNTLFFGMKVKENGQQQGLYATRLVIKDNLTNLPATNLRFSLASNAYCEHLERIDTTPINSLYRAFSSLQNVHGLDGMAQWNTENVTRMDQIFENAKFETTDIPNLGNWDTSKVTTLYSAFYRASGSMEFAKNWNTSNVTNMENIFYETTLDKLEVANWNTSNVTTLRYAFKSYTADTDISELVNWDTSNVEDMSYMFAYATTGNIEPIRNWSLASCKNLCCAFAYNGNFGSKAFDVIKNWDVSNVNNFNSIFREDSGFNTVSLNWNFKNATDMSYMFYRCSGLTAFTNGSSWAPEQETNLMVYTFAECTKLSNIEGLAGWNTSNVTDMSHMFYKTNIDNLSALSNWDVRKVANMSYTFAGQNSDYAGTSYGNVVDIHGVSNWQTDSLVNMSGIFAYNIYLDNIDAVSEWNTSNVSDMSNAFNSTKIKNLDALSNWNTGNVTSMSGMFYNCREISDISGVANWNVSKVTDLSQMFYQYVTGKLKDASVIGNWTTSALTSYRNMFANQTSLQMVDLRGFNFADSCNDEYAFLKCNNLVKITLPENYKMRYSSSYGPFNSTWKFETTGESVNLQNDVLTSFTNEKAGTYYKVYDIVLYPMGGKLDDNRITRTILDAVELPVPTRDNYTFLGWYDSNGDKIESVEAGQYVDTLFAKWETDVYYTLILDPNLDGVDPVQVRLNPEELYNLKSSVFSGVPSEYEFLFWTERKSNAGTKYKDGAEISHLGEKDDVVTLYAQWISHKTIPVNVHLVNIVTGETVDNGQLNVTLNTTSTKSDLSSVFKNTNINDANNVQYCSYKPGLDVVHHNYSEDDVVTLDWKYSVYMYNGKFSDTGFSHYDYLDQNLIKIEASEFINWTSHTWVASDYGKDIYAYYLPAPRIKLYFNTQQEAWFPIDELVMTVDGKEYRSGEYEVVIPWQNDNGLNSYYSYTDDNGNNVTSCYTPDWYLNMMWYGYSSSIAETICRELREKGYYFNYPAYFYQEGSFSNFLGEEDVFPTTEEAITGNVSYHYTNRTISRRHYNDVEGVVIGLGDLDLVYDTNCDDASFNNRVNHPQRYMVHFTQLGYQSGNPATLKNYPVNYTPKRSGYVFDGWWTKPEGGVQILRPGENYSNTFPHDISICDVVQYAPGVISSDNPQCYMSNRESFSMYYDNGYVYTYSTDQTNNRFVTMYAHWIPEDEWVNPYPGTDFNPNTDYEFTQLTIHNSHDSQSEKTIRITGAPTTSWPDEMNIPFEQTDINNFEDCIFSGWYTEPNGQGTLIEQVTNDNQKYANITWQPGVMDVYAYWTKPENIIYFDGKGADVHPNNVRVLFSQGLYADMYNDSITPAYVKCADTIAAKFIPFAITTENYEFLGWFDEDGNKLEVGSTIVNKATYVAHWKPIDRSSEGLTYDCSFTTGSDIYVMPYNYMDYLPTYLNFEIQLDDDILLPAGAIKIYLPSDEILNSDQMSTDTNISQGKYFKYKTLSQYNDEDLEDLKYGEIVITNGEDLTGSASFSMSQTYCEVGRYYLRMTDAEGNVYSRYDKKATIYKSDPVIVMIDKDLDGTPEIVEYKYIYMKSAPNPVSTPYSVYDGMFFIGNLLDSSNYEDGDDYYYVNWRLTNYNSETGAQYNNNTNMNFYYNLLDSQGGEIVQRNQSATYNGVDYDSSYLTGGYGWANNVIVKYPKSQFNYNAQRAVIRQPITMVASPLYDYSDGSGKYDRTVNLIGTLTITWSEGESFTRGNEVWANMGRYKSDSFVSLSNSDNEIKLQRQMAKLGRNAEGFSWFALYSQWDKYNRKGNTAVTVEPGDFSYVSGADPEFWMYNPITGRTFLTEDDYAITGYTVYYYGGNSNGDYKTSVARSKPFDIYVKYRGSDEWVLEYSGTGSSSNKSYDDGHESCIFTRQQSKTFYNDDVVAVSFKAEYDDDANYQVLCIVPRIKLLNTARTKTFTNMDFDQEVESVIAMNDFVITNVAGSNVTYTSGNWGQNLIWDEDLGLCDWFLTSDASPLELRNNVVVINEVGRDYYFDDSISNEGDVQINLYAINRSTDASTYYVPIDSGEYYILLPEGTSVKRHREFDAAGSSANLTSLYRNVSDGYYAWWGNVGNHNPIPKENKTYEVIENWENSGRTMIKYTFNNLTSLHNIDYDLNAIHIVLDLNRDEESLEIFGYKGNIASMFINTSGTPFVSQVNSWDYFTNGRTSGPLIDLVRANFTNISNENASKTKSTAYNAVNFNFYSANPTAISETVTHQNGFNEFVANSSGKFSNGTQVFPGETYTYKVYWSQSDYHSVELDNGSHDTVQTKTTGIIMYTKLDTVGKLQEAQIPKIKGKVYTSETEFEDVTVAPVVWYCTDPAFANISNDEFKTMDMSTLVLDEDHGWTNTWPTDKQVYGLIFDYSKDDQGRLVTYEKDKYININLYMKNMSNESQTFTSTSRMLADGFALGNDVTGGNMLGEVVLPDMNINVTSKPVSGTQDSPTPVKYEQDLIYTWKVKNNEDRAIQNVKVTFDVPDGTTCPLNKIMAGNTPITENVNITDVSLVDGKVSFTIKQLDPNSTFTVTENTYVSIGENDILITNQGFITGYNDIIPSDTQKESLKSDITYHITANVPEPTGFATSALPYALVLGTFGAVGYYVAKKKKKEQLDK